MAKDELGQVWTPQWLVELILDEVGYTADNPEILTKRILEPSFGEGAFLTEIVRRVLAGAKAAKLDAQETVAILQEVVWGIEYDPDVHALTMESLNKLTHLYQLPPVRWNLLLQDALTYKPQQKFRWVVGNPPYIRVHDMDATMRAHIQAYASATGTTDLYVLFFELGLAALDAGGSLGYVTPNSYLRNTSQRSFRDMLVTFSMLEKIIDFGSDKVFDKAATYAAVTILSKKPVHPTHFTYVKRQGAVHYEVSVPYATVKQSPGEQLVFADEADSAFLAEVALRPKALGDVLNVQYGVATLRDKIYTATSANVEAAVLRPVVKASTYKGQPITQQIVFPYRRHNDRIEVIDEFMLSNIYFGAHAFFLANEEELLARDRDKGSLWYAYGRSQGLQAIDQPKLTVSHVVAPSQTKLQAHILAADVVVYSGLFLTELAGGLTLEEIKAVLESDDFCRWVKIHGKDMGGGYKSFTAKTLKAYQIA